MTVKDFLTDVPEVSLVRRRGKIHLQVYFARSERKFYSTGIDVDEKNWCNGIVIGRPDAPKINTELYKKVEELQRKLISISVRGEELSIYTIDNAISKDEKQNGNFLDYMLNRIIERDITTGTKKNHMVAYNALRRFGLIRSFASLTPPNIHKFDDFLRKENKKRTQTTLHRFHKTVKYYVGECVRMGLIDTNPYNQFIDVHGKHKERQPLTEEMIVRVRDADLAGKYCKTRDLYILMCYTGLSYVDMQTLQRSDIIERDGRLYIKSRRGKTKEAFYTPVLPPAREILEKYDFKIPSISNQKMNKYLHDIEQVLEIPVPMTCHVARHSFATLMLSYDVPLPVVAKMLGHASTKTTEIYAKILQNNVEKKTEMIFDKIM